ncbi:MAG: N5-glutamine methyltransferase [Pseudomonadota bacterium]
MIATQMPRLGELIDTLATRFDEADLFYGHGTDNPWDEAVYLVFCALQIPFTADERIMTRLVTPQEQQKVDMLAVRRLQERRPVAYLVGEAWFAGQPFTVNEHVLIPRSPIAELIQQEFATLLPRTPVHILDLCTGSGCIGIATALAFADSRVVLADISPEALDVARANVERHGVSARVSVLESDLFAALQGPYDLILSNPPYVSQEEVDELPPEYRHEPSLGLVSEDDGLAIPLRILREAADLLAAEGVLIMEVGYSREALSARLPEVPLSWLEFANGGDGVLLLTREQLLAFRQHFA